MEEINLCNLVAIYKEEVYYIETIYYYDELISIYNNMFSLHRGVTKKVKISEVKIIKCEK